MILALQGHRVLINAAGNATVPPGYQQFENAVSETLPATAVNMPVNFWQRVENVALAAIDPFQQVQCIVTYGANANNPA